MRTQKEDSCLQGRSGFSPGTESVSSLILNFQELWNYEELMSVFEATQSMVLA